MVTALQTAVLKGLGVGLVEKTRVCYASVVLASACGQLLSTRGGLRWVKKNTSKGGGGRRWPLLLRLNLAIITH
jgi:hypothetical protein